jgi:hypothetical protein
LSNEERAAKKAARRAEWQSMTEEERADMRGELKARLRGGN